MVNHLIRGGSAKRSADIKTGRAMKHLQYSNSSTKRQLNSFMTTRIIFELGSQSSLRSWIVWRSLSLQDDGANIVVNHLIRGGSAERSGEIKTERAMRHI